MAWTAPRTWVSSELVTAALMNTHVRDNDTALRAGGIAIASQAANDLIIAASATQLGRIGAVSSAMLVTDNAGVPSLSQTVPAGLAATITELATLHVNGGFGCNNAAIQTPYASGGALGVYRAGGYGLLEAGDVEALYALVVAMRAALVANGIMS